MKYYKLSTKFYVYMDEFQSELPRDLNIAYLDTLPFNVDFKNINCKAATGAKKISNFIITTNVMAVSGYCFDEKVKTLLKNFNLPLFQLYPIEVTFNNYGYQYYWFRLLLEPLLNVVNFEESIFIHRETKQTINYSVEELKKVKNPPPIINLIGNLEAEIKELAINSKFAKYDLISLGGSFEYYVSEKLKNAMEKNKITGVEFKEIATKIV